MVKSEKAVSNTTTVTDTCIVSVGVKTHTCNETQDVSSKRIKDEQGKILERGEEKARLVLVRDQIRKMKPIPKCKFLMNFISEGVVPGFTRRREGGKGVGGASGEEGGRGQLRWASPPRDSTHRHTPRIPTEGVLCLQRLRGGGVTLYGGAGEATTCHMSGTKGTLSTRRLNAGTSDGHARLEQDGEEEEDKLEPCPLFFKGRLRTMTPIPILLLNLTYDCLFETPLRLHSGSIKALFRLY